MDVLPPTPEAPAEALNRRRGRKPGQALTPRELAARRSNLEKARTVSNRSYRRTEKRLDASRANLAKAQAGRRTPEGNASARLNALKHGLFASGTLAESVDRLGEDKDEFARHLLLFERIFAPADEEEKLMVRELGETVWRRLRFFHAQARGEKERLEKIFAEAPPANPRDVRDSVARAHELSLALMEFDAFFRELTKLQSKVEFWLRKLIDKRSQGKIQWKGFTPRRDPSPKKR